MEREVYGTDSCHNEVLEWTVYAYSSGHKVMVNVKLIIRFGTQLNQPHLSLSLSRWVFLLELWLTSSGIMSWSFLYNLMKLHKGRLQFSEVCIFPLFYNSLCICHISHYEFSFTCSVYKFLISISLSSCYICHLNLKMFMANLHLSQVNKWLKNLFFH
jgi:hypothetical protein